MGRLCYRVGKCEACQILSTPKVVTFPKKNELARVGLEPTTLYTLACIYRMWKQNTTWILPQLTEMSMCLCVHVSLMRFGPSQLSWLGSSVVERSI